MARPAWVVRFWSRCSGILNPKRRGPARAVILLGHGTRGTVEARPFLETCRRLERATGRPCRDAYLALCPPSLDEAVDALAAEGAAEVCVLPLFLVEGHHMRQDLPALLDACARRHPRLRMGLAPTLLADGAILDLLRRRLGQERTWGGAPEAGPLRVDWEGAGA